MIRAGVIGILNSRAMSGPLVLKLNHSADPKSKRMLAERAILGLPVSAGIVAAPSASVAELSALQPLHLFSPAN